MASKSTRKPGIVGEFFTGVGFVGKGFRVWVTAPKLMWLGLIPALIVAAAFVVVVVAFGINAEAIATWATPFANGWDEPWRSGIRFIGVLAFFVLALFFFTYTFTAVTLIVGDPFYERIWRHVEEREGGLPVERQEGFWHTLGRGLADIARMLVPTILLGILIFALGFIPVVGQVLSPVLGALVGGWFLTVELTGLAFDARGHSLRYRRRTLRGRRALSVGFGVATYLLFLVPLGAVIAMPAAVAGAALLSRRVLESEPQVAEPNRVVTPGE
ncbi:MAG: EI24 domain-containing protein [Rhodoglobus sp.]